MSDSINEHEDESLSQDNELRKMKLSLERGASFGKPDGSPDIDPAIENEFLKYVELFESAHDNCKRIKLFEFLGSPEFPKLEDIDAEYIESELEKLYLILDEKGVNLDTLCPVEPAELYRFITEEFFQEEIDDVHIPGMMSCFIYEEYYPNDDFDLRNETDNFLKFLLNKENDFYKYSLSKDYKDSQEFENFRDSFSTFTDIEIEIRTLEIIGLKAKVLAELDFTGQVEGSNILHRYAGKCALEFIKEDESWSISSFQLPENYQTI